MIEFGTLLPMPVNFHLFMTFPSSHKDNLGFDHQWYPCDNLLDMFFIPCKEKNYIKMFFVFFTVGPQRAKKFIYPIENIFPNLMVFPHMSLINQFVAVIG